MSPFVFSPQCAAHQEVKHEGPDKGKLKVENGVMMYNNVEYHKCKCEQKIEAAVITLNKVKQRRQQGKRWSKSEQTCLRANYLLYKYNLTNVLHLETIANSDK